MEELDLYRTIFDILDKNPIGSTTTNTLTNNDITYYLTLTTLKSETIVILTVQIGEDTQKNIMYHVYSSSASKARIAKDIVEVINNNEEV